MIPLHLLWGPPGGWEWVIILVVVLIFFGNRIPGLARSLGSGITEFKSGLKEGESDAKSDAKDTSSGSSEEKA
jgi:sec-independent protein translocase protein TatA